jgi:hypothetical protein
MPVADPARTFLRHTLATLVYRGGKSLRDAPPEFATFKCGPSTRTPGEILAHIGDLFDWALSIARGAQAWQNSPPQSWDGEVDRFFAAIARFDEYLASDAPLGAPSEKLFQGPVADALMHFGQIAMLRRLAGAPIKGENYFQADVAVGRVGKKQTPARAEFG